MATPNRDSVASGMIIFRGKLRAGLALVGVGIGLSELIWGLGLAVCSPATFGAAAGVVSELICVEFGKTSSLGGKVVMMARDSG